MTFAGPLGQGCLVKRGGRKEEGRERVKRVKLVPVSQYLLSIGDTYRDHSVTKHGEFAEQISDIQINTYICHGTQCNTVNSQTYDV